jgi:hypothetical protein
MAISLHATIAPDRLPATSMVDARIRLVLRNDGAAPAQVSPGIAKLAAVASYAGIGITWNLGFADDAEVAPPMRELRRYHGPPGNPPSPAWAQQQAIALAPGAEHATELIACWIPNAQLEPRHLTREALDPAGMDGIAELAAQLPLARASVLAFGTTSARLAAARAGDDFLRGHVVALFTRPGTYRFHAHYVQHSWMGVGERLTASAPPVALQIE